MGLFNFWGNYDKPGPGVSKDELPKAAPIRFFEIFGRKFTKLLPSNVKAYIWQLFLSATSQITCMH